MKNLKIFKKIQLIKILNNKIVWHFLYRMLLNNGSIIYLEKLSMKNGIFLNNILIMKQSIIKIKQNNLKNWLIMKLYY